MLAFINEEREENLKKPFPPRKTTSSRQSMHQEMAKSPLGGKQQFLHAWLGP
jgi:hypothetical protein